MFTNWCGIPHPKITNTDPRGYQDVMRVEMMSIWVSKVCRNGSLKSQFRILLSILRVCLQHYIQIRARTTNSQILERIKVR